MSLLFLNSILNCTDWHSEEKNKNKKSSSNRPKQDSQRLLYCLTKASLLKNIYKKITIAFFRFGFLIKNA